MIKINRDNITGTHKRYTISDIMEFPHGASFIGRVNGEIDTGLYVVINKGLLRVDDTCLFDDPKITVCIEQMVSIEVLVMPVWTNKKTTPDMRYGNK